MYVANFLSMFKPLHCLHFWCIQLCRSHGRICNVFVMVLTYNIRQLRRYVRCGAHAGFKRFHPFLTSFKAIVIIFYGLCSLLLAIRISLACTLCVEQCLCVCIRYKSVLWAIEIRYLQTIIRVSFRNNNNLSTFYVPSFLYLYVFAILCANTPKQSHFAQQKGKVSMA